MITSLHQNLLFNEAWFSFVLYSMSLVLVAGNYYFIVYTFRLIRRSALEYDNFE